MNKNRKFLLTLILILSALLFVSCGEAASPTTAVPTTASTSAVSSTAAQTTGAPTPSGETTTSLPTDTESSSGQTSSSAVSTAETTPAGTPSGEETPTFLPSETASGTDEDCTHSYVFSAFEWTGDNRANAVFVCEKNEAHRVAYEAKVTEVVTREATSALAGEKLLTARYEEYTGTRTVSFTASEVTLTIYAVNDFHGAVNEESDRAGLAKFATYFKEKGEDGNTLLIDSGDTWQGSLASNYNSGRMLCDIYNYIGMDAKTVGNHEFDWSPEVIERNAAYTSFGRTTPFLAANIYDYDITTKTAGSVQQERLGKKSVTYVMDSGLKVGIVGAIDDDCISGINSLNMLELCFTNHIRAIKDEATALRAQGCDIVICSIHGGEDCVRGQGLSEYVDLVLCAHSHALESSREGSLLFAQFKANGEYFGKITLTCRPAEKTCRTDMTVLSATEVKNAVGTVDPTIERLMSDYAAEYRADADVVVAKTVYGSFTSREELPNLMCRAMFDAAKKEGYNVCLAYVNKARATLSAGTWTYEDLYQAFPFDDLVFIADVTGREILNEIAKYNFIYLSPDFTGPINPNATYTIACIDYLLFHNDASRDFNYFPETAGKFTAALKDNYRVILRDWLIENGYAEGKILSSVYYKSNVASFDRNQLK